MWSKVSGSMAGWQVQSGWRKWNGSIFFSITTDAGLPLTKALTPHLHECFLENAEFPWQTATDMNTNSALLAFITKITDEKIFFQVEIQPPPSQTCWSLTSFLQNHSAIYAQISETILYLNCRTDFPTHLILFWLVLETKWLNNF